MTLNPSGRDGARRTGRPAASGDAGFPRPVLRLAPGGGVRCTFWPAGEPEEVLLLRCERDLRAAWLRDHGSGMPAPPHADFTEAMVVVVKPGQGKNDTWRPACIGRDGDAATVVLLERVELPEGAEALATAWVLPQVPGPVRVEKMTDAGPDPDAAGRVT